MTRHFSLRSEDIKPKNLILRWSSLDFKFTYIQDNTISISIPLEVISENFDGKQYVYLVNDSGKAEKRFIETGLIEGAVVEVLSGLSLTDKIIAEGARLVKENENVQVTN